MIKLWFFFQFSSLIPLCIFFQIIYIEERYFHIQKSEQWTVVIFKNPGPYNRGKLCIETAPSRVSSAKSGVWMRANRAIWEVGVIRVPFTRGPTQVLAVFTVTAVGCSGIFQGRRRGLSHYLKKELPSWKRIHK